MRLPRSMLGWLFGCALVPVACGDDGQGTNPLGDAGEAGEAGGSEAGAGGSNGSGATSSAGAGEAALGGAEAAMAGGTGEGGSGPIVQCTQREQIPDPVVGTLQVQPICP